MQVTGLFCYPVKSLGGMTLDHADFDDFGICWDRRFMLVDAEGHYVTQRKQPVLSLFSASIRGASGSPFLAITTPQGQVLEFALAEFTRELSVKVWSDQVVAYACDPLKIAALSDATGVTLELVFMPDSTFRQVNRDWFDAEQRVSFADGFPVLLTTEASLAELNSRLQTPVPMKRFRPNIVIDGAAPYAEDVWQHLRMGALDFDLVKPCSRCVMTTIDDTGNKGKEPLKTLTTYRKNDVGVCFGQNLVHRSQGRLHLGDPVQVTGT
jgi:uncharacterized protein